MHVPSGPAGWTSSRDRPTDSLAAAGLLGTERSSSIIKYGPRRRVLPEIRFFFARFLALPAKNARGSRRTLLFVKEGKKRKSPYHVTGKVGTPAAGSGSHTGTLPLARPLRRRRSQRGGSLRVVSQLPTLFPAGRCQEVHPGCRRAHRFSPLRLAACDRLPRSRRLLDRSDCCDRGLWVCAYSFVVL